MANSINIISTQRFLRDGRYYEKVTYKNEEGKLNTLEAIWRRKVPKHERIREYELRAKTAEHERMTEEKLERRRDAIKKTSTRYSKEKVFYQSFIKVYIIVRYGNNTPFYYPKRGRWSTITRSKNVTERGMLLSCMTAEELEEFKYWLEKGKTDSKVRVFHGWTYKRIISSTGSFNGDTKFLDWYQRQFVGSVKPVTIDYLAPYRKQGQSEELRL